MATLLELPRELRDMIWKLCLLANTRCIKPLNSESVLNDDITEGVPLSPHNYLLVQDPNTETDSLRTKFPAAEYISLSLLRTCRQIHGETKHLFWNSNTFMFSTSSHLRTIFNSMGQTASRCITSIHLRLGPVEGNVLGNFEEALDLLVRRSPGSSLRRLDLGLNQSNFLDILLRRHFGLRNLPFFFENFMNLMDLASQIVCEKRISVLAVSVETIKQWYPQMRSFIREEIKEIHFAWGGEFYWGRDLIWKDGVETQGDKFESVWPSLK